MADFAAPAGADADEKKRIDDIDGEMNALDDRLRSLADSADVAASDLSGDRRGSLRLLTVWATVSVVGTIGLGFAIDDESLFPRLPVSMFAGVVIGFLAALPAIRRDKTRMNQIAESATDVADQASELRRELTSIIFAHHHFDPADMEWASDHRKKAQGYERDLAASTRTGIADRAWASRARITPILLIVLFGATVVAGLTTPEGVLSWWASALTATVVVLGLGFAIASEASASERGQARQTFIAQNASANEKRWRDRIEAGVNRSSVKVASSEDDQKESHERHH